MTKISLKALPVMLVGASLAFGSAALADDATHTHIGHVANAWGDTPDGMGLLPAAIAEAQIAITHAGLAAQKLDDLGWMQTHANHVLQAVDASAIDGGPALGFGVLMGAMGTIKHIGLAAASEGASENVVIHAEHVSTPAKNTMAVVVAIKANIAIIQAATTAADAAAATEDNLRLTADLLDGADANDDGAIDWTDGGLNEAAKHLGIMVQLEGM